MAKKYQVIDDPRLCRMLFIMCWIAYFSTYLGRLNFSAAMPGIIGSELMSKAQAGLIGTAFFACYGIGQFFCGFLGDKLSSFSMVFGGIGISAMANVIMFFCPGALSMTVVWGINGLSQSMIWSPLLRILSQIFPEHARGKACVHINSTVACGTLCSYLISTFTMRYLGWRWVFMAAAILMFTAAFLWISGHKILKPYLSMEEISPIQKSGSSNQKGSLLPLILASGVIIMMLPTAIHGALKDGITTWVPTLLTEQFALSPDFAVLLSIALPVVNVIGAYVSDALNRKLIHDDMLTIGACFFICGLSLLGLRLFGGISPYLSVAFLAVSTSLMLGANVMLITIVPMHFGKLGKASTLTGILNSSAYVGCALSMMVFGGLSEWIGWDGTISVWIGMSAASILVCLLIFKKWRRFKESIK